jgi:hypothetical protein
MKKEKTDKLPKNLISLIQLVKVETTSFNVSDNNGKIKKEDIKRFNFDFNFQITTSFKDELAIFSPRLDLHFYDEHNVDLEGSSAHISARFYFHVKNLKNLVEEKEDKSLIMNTHLVVNIIGIIYSTLRGILLVKAQDTILEMVTLPVLNPIQLVNFSTK